MHRSYQPLKPVANRYLQQRWDQQDYENHRRKVGGLGGGGLGGGGLVDHQNQNQYHLRSLNADKRREELLLVSRQNEAIYQRITSRQSEHRRQLWWEDWERTRRRRDQLCRFPRGLAAQRSSRKVKFAAPEGSERSEGFSSAERTGRDP
ncbi:hypothetical protein EYF80_062498 [Liparis tanakae]|uniref:Uncharacterized protein n=1 Tax=Liparis tanakae TaxID=230148 RepID=A0A4Z2EF45_9TELE|nr:hypothetical protein EYF80_062498 [Liparis tanakae]